MTKLRFFLCIIIGHVINENLPIYHLKYIAHQSTILRDCTISIFYFLTSIIPGFSRQCAETMRGQTDGSTDGQYNTKYIMPPALKARGIKAYLS